MTASRSNTFSRRAVPTRLITMLMVIAMLFTGLTTPTAAAPAAPTIAFTVQFSTDGVNFSDNISVAQGNNVWVRLKYDNTGDSQATSAQAALTLPAGLTLVASSTRTCLTPSGSETVCNTDAGMGGAITEGTVWTGTALAMGPQDGLYNEAVDAATSIIEFGKKRYVNLHECRAEKSGSDIFYTTLKDTGTNASNTADSATATCTGDYSGDGYSAPTSNQVLNLDLLGLQYLNLQDCQYISGSDRIAVNTTGTATSNTAITVHSCPGTAGVHGYEDSLIAALDLRGNSFLNLKECQLFATPDNIFFNLKAGADTNTGSAADSVDNCDSVSGPYSKTGSTQLPLDLRDGTRGAGFVEFKLDTSAATVAVHNLAANLNDMSGGGEFSNQTDNGNITVTASVGSFTDLIIDTNATSGVTVATAGSLVTIKPTAPGANINITELNGYLDAGSTVLIDTSNANNGEVGDITIAATIQKSTGVDRSLTIRAANDIIQNSSVGITTIGGSTVAIEAGRRIVMNDSSTITAVDGNVTLTANSGASAGDFVGIYLDKATISTNSGTGAISLTGTGGTGTAAQMYGVHLNGGKLYTASGALTINGTSKTTGATGVGVRLDANGTDGAVVSTGSGNVSITGTASGTGSPGVFALQSPGTVASQILSTSGNITIDGTGSGWYGVDLEAATSVQSGGVGNVIITGSSASHDDVYFAASATVGSDTGNMTINADDFATDESATISGSGTLTVQPRTASTTIGLGGGAGMLNLTDGEIADFSNGFSSITIGKSDAGNITVDTATFNDPLTLLTGGSIVDAGAGGPHITVVDLLLDSGTGVGSLADPVDVEVTNVAARATTSGGVFIEDDSTLTVKSVGGVNGISANGGDISVTANGSASGNFIGIRVDGSAITTLGTGTISLTGNGGDTGDGNSGIHFVGTNPQITTVDGDITLVGTTGTGTGSTVVGIVSDPGIAITIQATGAGNISLTGTSSGAEGGGVILNTSSTVEANTGNITIVGTGKSTACGFGGYGTITSTGSGNVDLTGTTDSGPDACMAGPFNSGPSGSFTVNANTVQIDKPGATLEGKGALTFAPRTVGTTIGLGGGAGILSLVDDELTQLTGGFSSITIGKSDAGDITVDTAIFNDPLTLLTGGSIVNANNGGTDLTATTVTFDGTVAPLGTGSGTFGVSGNTTFASGTTFDVDLNGDTEATSHDKLSITGDINLNSATLNIDYTNYGAHKTGTITIVDETGILSGIFNGLPEGTQTNNGSTTQNFLVGYTSSATLTAAGPTAITLAGFSAGATGTPVLPLAVTLVGLALAGLALFFVRRRSVQA